MTILYVGLHSSILIYRASNVLLIIKNQWLTVCFLGVPRCCWNCWNTRPNICYTEQAGRSSLVVCDPARKKAIQLSSDSSMEFYKNKKSIHANVYMSNLNIIVLMVCKHHKWVFTRVSPISFEISWKENLN